MWIPNPLLIPLCMTLMASPLAAQRKPKVKPKSPVASLTELRGQIADLKAQLKAVTTERDNCKNKVDGASQAQEQLAGALHSRDLAKEESEAVKRELDSLKASLAENKSGGENLLKELKQARQEAAQQSAKATELRQQLEQANGRMQASKVEEGALVPLGPDIIPARPINLSRVRPTAKRIDRAVVVVNVLVSERGDVLDTRLLQGLPGQETEWTQKAHEACLDAAKRLVFEAARTKEGNTRVKVWQGVGFLLD